MVVSKSHQSCWPKKQTKAFGKVGFLSTLRLFHRLTNQGQLGAHLTYPGSAANHELREELDHMFGIEGKLEDPLICWQGEWCSSPWRQSVGASTCFNCTRVLLNELVLWLKYSILDFSNKKMLLQFISLGFCLLTFSTLVCVLHVVGHSSIMFGISKYFHHLKLFRKWENRWLNPLL